VCKALSSGKKEEREGGQERKGGVFTVINIIFHDYLILYHQDEV
jgi:hypothetical protein